MIVLFCPVGREESLADLHGSAWTGSARLIEASQKVPLTFFFIIYLDRSFGWGPGKLTTPPNPIDYDEFDIFPVEYRPSDEWSMSMNIFLVMIG